MKRSKKQVLDNFKAMIRLRTVSYEDESKRDQDEFRKFRELLKERYPHVFSVGEGWQVGQYGVLIRIPGRNPDPKKASVLMAHYDVVPVDGQKWSEEPFSAVEKDGRIYGRGTLDTKCTLCAIMEAAEYRASEGFVPEHDLFLSFGGEEEPSGPCCLEIVSFLNEKGVRPAFVLDEGGCAAPEGVPGLKKQVAMIGIAEKGTANYMVSIQGSHGGHASTPPKHTVIGRLAQCAVNIENNPFPARLSSPVQLMFRELAPYVPLWERPFFEHPEAVAPAIELAASHLGPSFNAMVRSTTAITIFEGTSSFNVLPDGAAMGVNVRLLEGDTMESAAEYLRKTAGDPDVEVRLISGTDPTPVSDINCDEYQMLKGTVEETWKDTVAAPYQLNGGTDSRFYSKISNHIYKFSPMLMTKEERATVHGEDESIRVGNLFRMIAFYIRLIGKL